jgi:hypothetical protein
MVAVSGNFMLIIMMRKLISLRWEGFAVFSDVFVVCSRIWVCTGPGVNLLDYLMLKPTDA